MARNIEYFIRVIREELRAEGTDGAGYTDFKIITALNTAMGELSENYPIRDVLTLTAVEDTNEYILATEFPTSEIIHIIHVTQGNTTLTGIDLNTYLTMADPTSGDYKYYLLWGDKIIFTGEVEEGDEFKLWVTRMPNKLTGIDDIPELPSFTDEALIQYAISACYRESRDYERSAYHLDLYNKEKNQLLRRGVPQKQRNHQGSMNAVYSEAITQFGYVKRSDTNPSGEV